jgi:uncharacterized protein
MKLRLFPRPRRRLLRAVPGRRRHHQCRRHRPAGRAQRPQRPRDQGQAASQLEHEGDRITRTILTRLAATFIARFDRDDLFELAERLDNVTDAIEDVGDMVLLHGITQPLDPVTEQSRVLLRAAEHTSQGMGSLDQLDPDRLNAYLTAIDDLEHQGDQLHRRVNAQLCDFTGEHPA